MEYCGRFCTSSAPVGFRDLGDKGTRTELVFLKIETMRGITGNGAGTKKKFYAHANSSFASNNPDVSCTYCS
jgi:hypothetical protein